MDLQEVFDQLTYGEFNQTGLVSLTTGAIIAADYPKLINFINLGVLALHKRFLLMEDESIIQMQSSVTDYHLKWAYALSNTDSSVDEADRYIVDSTATPFNRSRPIKILNVYNENGEEWDLNPVYVEDGYEHVEIAYTPSQLLLQIPFPVSDNAIGIVYQAAPNNIASTVTDLTTEVVIPDIMLEALLYFIAERYFVGMGTNRDEAKTYPSRYEKECIKIEQLGLLHPDNVKGSNRFRRNGWV